MLRGRELAERLRRRNHLMRKRAEFYAHIPVCVHRTGSQYNLSDFPGRIAKPQNRDGIAQHFEDPSVQKMIDADLAVIEAYDPIIAKMERDIISMANHHDPVAYALLKSIPAIGKMLGLVILYEIENINRFPTVQDFVSYSRLVKCSKESNGKKSGASGKKIGNAHPCLCRARQKGQMGFQRSSRPFPQGQRTREKVSRQACQ